MRLVPSDPDISTIISRINREDINLQPEFQRGEVWSMVKKQKLIDSILRDWHIPPIHVIEVKETLQLEVLDGQQRLATIRDFVNDRIKIDGLIHPISGEISKLHNLFYSQMPIEWKRKFDQFTLRLFKITDYEPEEPGELFYRLNQTVVLTAAEQRNAFFSDTRQQVKDLVDALEDISAYKGFIGFTNARMAYDDIIARFCLYLEEGKLTRKIVGSDLTDLYRMNKAFSGRTINLARKSIVFMGNLLGSNYISSKFNKATLFSWLWFISSNISDDNDNFDNSLFGKFLSEFEQFRREIRSLSNANNDKSLQFTFNVFEFSFVEDLMTVYADRSSARVSDVSSVLTRDIIIWLMFYDYKVNRGITTKAEKLKFGLINDIIKHEKGKYKPKADAIIFDLIENGWNGNIPYQI